MDMVSRRAESDQMSLPFGSAPERANTPSHTTELRLTITVEEAGVRLGISRSLAYAAARNGTLPTIRFGRRLLVPVCQLEALLAGQHRSE